MKKFNLTKGLAGRLTGGLIGGAVSAAWDKYALPMLGDTVAGYENYVKVGVGAVLPALIKGNQMVTSIGDSLIAIGADRIVADLLNTVGTPATAGVTYVNGGNFPRYREFVNATKPAAAKKETSPVR